MSFKGVLQASVVATVLSSGAASAATIFSDNFQSGNLNNWIISDSNPTDIFNFNFGGTQGRVMYFRAGDGSDPDGTATATSSIPNTSAYTNLQLSFQWYARSENETSDTLQVQWRTAGVGNWNTIITLASEGTGGLFLNSGLLNIGAPVGTDIDLRFVLNLSQENEGFKIDNIVLSGTLPVPGPFAGAGLPGLALAFGGLMLWRRWRQYAA